MSVPFTTVTTYAPRQDLSEELEQKLGKPHRGHGLAHAVAVTGLGGTGKTQLVLRYLEEREGKYNTILWLDARSQYGRASSGAAGLSVFPSEIQPVKACSAMRLLCKQSYSTSMRER